MADADVTLRPQQPGQGTNDVFLFLFAAPVYTYVNVADSGAGLELPAIQGAMTLNDAGSGSEARSILASFTVADVGTGLESPISKQFEVLDSALGIDRFAIRVLRSGRLQYTVRLRVTENVFDPTAYDPYAYE
ncbi:MAG: hypothetical protein WB661_01700 [Candidatus Bathyarchaeia archaeon]